MSPIALFHEAPEDGNVQIGQVSQHHHADARDAFFVERQAKVMMVHDVESPAWSDHGGKPV